MPAQALARLYINYTQIAALAEAHCETSTLDKRTPVVANEWSPHYEEGGPP